MFDMFVIETLAWNVFYIKNQYAHGFQHTCIHGLQSNADMFYLSLSYACVHEYFVILSSPSPSGSVVRWGRHGQEKEALDGGRIKLQQIEVCHSQSHGSMLVRINSWFAWNLTWLAGDQTAQLMTCLQRKLDVEEAGLKHREMLGKKRYFLCSWCQQITVLVTSRSACEALICFTICMILHYLTCVSSFFPLPRAPLPVSDLKDLPIGAAF